MDYKQFIVEILNFTAWPIVLTIAIFTLKDKVLSLFGGGIKSAKHGDSEVHFFESTQKIKSEVSINQNLQQLIPIDTTGLRKEIETKIYDELAQINNEDEKIDILIKNFAQAQITNNMDKIYFYIYGSQIELLEYLTIQNNQSANIQNIIPFFEEAKTKYPDTFSKTHFSDYMNFLISWDLIQNIEDKWIITKRGSAFVKHITTMQYRKDKLL